MILRIFVLILFSLSVCGIANGQSVKNLNPSLLEAEWGFWMDAGGEATLSSLRAAPFWSPNDPKTKDYQDYLRWLMGPKNQPTYWMRLILTNRSIQRQELILNTGNIEYAKFYHSAAPGRYESAGLFRNPLGLSQLNFNLEALQKDTLYISMENYVVEAKDVTVYVGLLETIKQKHLDFEAHYWLWYYFQHGFLFLFLFLACTVFSTWLLQRKRKEFLYYVVYLAAFAIFFAALFLEVKARSFTLENASGAPPFSVFYLKGLLIVYSWAYFYFFNYYLLDYQKQDVEITILNRFVEMIQIIILLMEVCLLLSHIPTSIKLYGFMIGGALLTLVALCYNITIELRREHQIKYIEVKIMNGVAMVTNLVVIPFTIYELYCHKNWLSPAGFFALQLAALTEALFFHFTSNQKTKRLQRGYLEQLSMRLKAEKAKVGIGKDFHDTIGGHLSVLGYKTDIIKRLFGAGDKEKALAKLQEIDDIVKKAEEDLRWLIWLADQRNSTLHALLQKIQNDLETHFSDTEVLLHIVLPIPEPQFEINPLQQKSLFLFIKEAMENARKHAEASNIYLSFLWQQATAEFQLVIRDDGKGFEAYKRRPGGYGLDSLKDRAEELRATLTIDSVSSGGTVLVLEGRLSELPEISSRGLFSRIAARIFGRFSNKIAHATLQTARKALKFAKITS